MARRSSGPRDALEASRDMARHLAERAGGARTQAVLERAHDDLVRRLRRAVRTAGSQSFTAEQLRVALRQVRAVLPEVKAGIRGAAVDGGREAAEAAGEGAARYMEAADRAYGGVGRQPLALDQAAMVDAAVSGAQASVLRRLASSGTPQRGADAQPHPAKQGVLDRYGVATVGRFEQILQTGLIARKSWSEMQAELVAESPFLQGQPAFWARRIVRTEVMAASNRAAWEASREADEQLGDVVKVLAATFDDRTGADSIAVHGQLRRVDEPFESWFGPYVYPPNRPNDREVVVTHRLSWDLPKYLLPRSDAEVLARWRAEGRKGAPPARPRMSTLG